MAFGHPDNELSGLPKCVHGFFKCPRTRLVLAKMQGKLIPCILAMDRLGALR